MKPKPLTYSTPSQPHSLEARDSLVFSFCVGCLAAFSLVFRKPVHSESFAGPTVSSRLSERGEYPTPPPKPVPLPMEP